MTITGNPFAAAGVAAASLTCALALAQDPKPEAPPARELAKPAAKENLIELKAGPVQLVIPAPAPAPAQEKPAARVRVFRERRGRAVFAPAGGDVGPTAARFVQQLRPSFRAELRLLTTVTSPTPAQRREIALDGGRALKKAARKVAGAQQALQQGVREEFPDPVQQVREALAASVKARLSADQYDLYRAELDRRVRDQRQAIVLNLVANLDHLLMLNPEQRKSIEASLLKNWDDETYPTLGSLANYEQYFPNVPDGVVSRFLKPAQRKTWQGIQKVNFGTILDFNLNLNDQEAADDDDRDEDEEAALAAEDVKE